METSRNSRMPLGEELSKVRRWVLFSTNSAMNLSTAVVTSGVSAHASSTGATTGKCAGSSQSNSRPAPQGGERPSAPRPPRRLPAGASRQAPQTSVWSGPCCSAGPH